MRRHTGEPHRTGGTQLCVATLVGHTSWVTFLAVLDDSRYGPEALVVWGSAYETVRLWDGDAHSCMTTATGHTGAVMCLAVVDGSECRNGARVFSGSRDGTVRIWTLETQSYMATLAGCILWITCMHGPLGRPSEVPSTRAFCAQAQVDDELVFIGTRG